MSANHCDDNANWWPRPIQPNTISLQYAPKTHGGHLLTEYYSMSCLANRRLHDNHAGFLTFSWQAC